MSERLATLILGIKAQPERHPDEPRPAAPVVATNPRCRNPSAPPFLVVPDSTDGDPPASGVVLDKLTPDPPPTSGPPSRRRGVTVTWIWGGSLRDNEVGPGIYVNFLPGALAAGTYRPAPEATVVGEGLESIPIAIKQLKQRSPPRSSWWRSDPALDTSSLGRPCGPEGPCSGCRPRFGRPRRGLPVDRGNAGGSVGLA